MTARQQLKRRDWPAAFFRSLGHASWAAEQTEAGACAEGPRPPFLIAFRRDIPLFKSVSKLGHDQSVAPANLEPIKSNLAQRLVGGAQPYRTKNDTKLGGIVLFKNNRRQSRQFETAVDGPNLVGTRCNSFLSPAIEPNNSSARNGFLPLMKSVVSDCQFFFCGRSSNAIAFAYFSSCVPLALTLFSTSNGCKYTADTGCSERLRSISRCSVRPGPSGL